MTRSKHNKYLLKNNKYLLFINSKHCCFVLFCNDLSIKLRKMQTTVKTVSGYLLKSYIILKKFIVFDQNAIDLAFY